MAETVKREVEFLNETASLSEMRGFVREVFQSADINGTTARMCVIAIDEAVASIVRRAKMDKIGGFISLSIDIDDVRIRVSINDSSNLFDPGGMKTDEFHRFVEGRRSLEMGVFLIRQIMDEIEYVYRKGFENQLVLTKFLL